MKHIKTLCLKCLPIQYNIAIGTQLAKLAIGTLLAKLYDKKIWIAKYKSVDMIHHVINKTPGLPYSTLKTNK